MKNIDDLLNNLPEGHKEDIGYGIEISEDFKKYMNHESTIERMKEYQYLYMQTMHKLQIEVQKVYGISIKRQGEIKKK